VNEASQLEDTEHGDRISITQSRKDAKKKKKRRSHNTFAVKQNSFAALRLCGFA
jgi:hypothetical protein